jgi:hypothetical protein
MILANNIKNPFLLYNITFKPIIKKSPAAAEDGKVTYG